MTVQIFFCPDSDLFYGESLRINERSRENHIVPRELNKEMEQLPYDKLPFQ
ncbi:hypothetical protein AB4Z29_16030 [Paenibacillus sp. 2TAB23]|uniref:hypothetical protein n=1 Tax=Paenibacillus sp. 2TAB23 TaxID=3233004 RepID=UPI003F95A181